MNFAGNFRRTALEWFVIKWNKTRIFLFEGKFWSFYLNHIKLLLKRI